jgi:hypothetical protein
MNRASWDLAEDGPVKWTGTYEDNQGPDVGAEVVPGTYVVRLTADGVTKSESVVVKADPRDPAASGYQARHDFLAGLFGELSAIDTMLNAIDARMKRASGAQAARLAVLRRSLTYDPHNIEDLSGPAALREKVLDLLSRMGSSFQAPTAAQSAQAAAYKEQFEALQAAYKNL